MKILVLMISIFLLTAEFSFAGDCHDGKSIFPPSFDPSNRVLHSEVPAFQTKGIDVAQLQKKYEGTVQFAEPLLIEMDLFHRGIILNLPCGQWSLLFRIQTPNAFSMNLHIDQIRNIPNHTKVWHYSGQYIDGKIKANTTGDRLTIQYHKDLNDRLNSKGELATVVILKEHFFIELLFPEETSFSEMQSMSMRIKTANAAFLDVW